MKIGILSKREGHFAGEIQKHLEINGHDVQIYTAENLHIMKFYLIMKDHTGKNGKIQKV